MTKQYYKQIMKLVIHSKFLLLRLSKEETYATLLIDSIVWHDAVSQVDLIDRRSYNTMAFVLPNREQKQEYLYLVCEFCDLKFLYVTALFMMCFY